MTDTTDTPPPVTLDSQIDYLYKTLPLEHHGAIDVLAALIADLKDDEFRSQVGMANACMSSIPLQQAIAAFAAEVRIGNPGQGGVARVIGPKRQYEYMVAHLPLRFPPLPTKEEARKARLEAERIARENPVPETPVEDPTAGPVVI